MLRKITSFAALDGRKLMDLYAEGNRENAEEFSPDCPDRDAAVQKVEEDFLRYLKESFFPTPGNSYWILEEDGVWVSALRVSEPGEGIYYLEALETREDHRRRGCASRLLLGLMEELRKQGPFRLCDCVNKQNVPSLKTHKRCGFRIARETGLDYLSGEENERCFGMEYTWEPDGSAWEGKAP